MRDRKHIKEFFLLLQFIVYFAGISFAAGGGNYPGLTPGTIVYLKALCLTVPLLGWTVHTVFNRRQSVSTTSSYLRQNWLIGLYLLFSVASLPLAVDPYYSGQRFLYMVFALSGLFSLMTQYADFSVRVLSYDTIILHVTILTMVSLVFPLYVLAQYGMHNPIPGYREALQNYLFIHPNLLASFYAQLAIFHAACIAYSKRRYLWMQKLCLVILLLFIVLLFSRAVFVSLGATIFVISIYLANLLSKKSYFFLPLLVVLTTAAVGLAITTGIIDKSVLLSLWTRGDDTASLETLTNRTKLWGILLQEMDWQIFLLGHGYSVMTKGFGVDFGTGILYGAHNAYLSILLGTGIFSLICVISYLAMGLLSLIKQRLTLPIFVSVSLLASLVIFAVNCLTAEEMGVSVTVTFAYLVFILNMLLWSPQRTS